VPEVPLTGSAIRDYLVEVAEALPDAGQPQSVVVVGGSLMALRGLRSATVDVDSVARLDDELRAAVRVVADRHGLVPGWLNDSAAGFAPATLDLAGCEVLLEHGRLRVLGAPLAQVFVMKLYAARSRDIDDLAVLWRHCGFTNPEEAVEPFWRAYPHAPDDPDLVEFVAQVAGRIR